MQDVFEIGDIVCGDVEVIVVYVKDVFDMLNFGNGGYCVFEVIKVYVVFGGEFDVQKDGYVKFQFFMIQIECVFSKDVFGFQLFDLLLCGWLVEFKCMF